MDDLREERERVLGLIESLQSAESRRGILEELVGDLQREGEERERELARVARAVVGRDARTRELEAELAQSASRIARLEQQASSLAAALAERDAELRRSQQDPRRAPRERPASPRTRPGSSGGRARTRPGVAVGQGSGDARQESELARLRAERAELTKTLAEVRAATAAAATTAGGHDEALAEVRARNAELESALAAERRRFRELEKERASARRETQDWAGALETAQHERSAEAERLAAAQARVKEPEEHAAEQREATRLLVRSEDGREIMHVLGRRTSIGRTPDNDLQIEADFISRHHAVILVGPVHTIVEDLNSSNGVHVNGRRVTRQILRDGDVVHFARLQYRFVVRRAGEKR